VGLDDHLLHERKVPVVVANLEYDFVIIGSGAAGLTAAIAAHDRGLRPLVVEKTDKIGGTTAYSGGAIWLPNNHVARAVGVTDSREKGLEYMQACIGDVGPASSPERKAAYLDDGDRMVRFLEQAGFRWRPMLTYPDYYPERPGGMKGGRSLEGYLFDTKSLGDWAQHLRTSPSVPALPIYSDEGASFLLALRTWKGFGTAVKVVGVRALGGRLRGKHLVGTGGSLVGHLLKIALDRGIVIWRNSPFLELTLDDDKRVTGVVVTQNGERLQVAARRGVLLAAGGFSRNLEMRQRYQEGPLDLSWTLVGPGDTGEADMAAMEAGAVTAMMERAWWMPSVIDPASGTTYMIIWERCLPHSITVDSTGQRFVNEATSYLDVGTAMLKRNREVNAIPSWLILDARHRRSYPFANLPPGLTPKSAIKSGFLIKANTLEELASKIHVDPATLRQTVQRFNGFARSGVDEDFGRGNSAYDPLHGDPRVKPNPNLGAIERAPFYATKLFLGDIGTKGGLLTDEHARVLGSDGEPIANLYATGNTTATVMGDSYPGAGSTIGPAMVFGYIAAMQAARPASQATAARP
jgi:3-oxosteroid 1-dehydrogenase